MLNQTEAAADEATAPIAQAIESRAPGLAQNVTDFVSTQGPEYTPPTNVGSTLGNILNVIRSIFTF